MRINLRDKESLKIHTLRDLIYVADDRFREVPLVHYIEKKQVYSKTYHEIRTLADGFGNFLTTLSGGKRLHVATIGANSYVYIAAYIGIINSNHIAVPIDSQLDVDGICELLDFSDADIICYDDKYARYLSEIKERCPKLKAFINMKQVEPEQLTEAKGIHQYSMQIEAATNQRPLAMAIEPDSFCTLIFTSGTTSAKSKGVMLSNRGILDNVFTEVQDYEPGTAIVGLLPFHHAFCITVELLLSCLLGLTICLNDSPFHLARNIQIFKPHHLILVPMIIENYYYKILDTSKKHPEIPISQIAKDAFGGKLEYLYSGGAHLSEEIVNAFFDMGIPVYEGYGMSECSPRVAANDVNGYKKNSIGKCLNNVKARIQDHEIQIQSTSLMLGYYKNPEETRAMYTEDGWFKTGDLGSLDEDGYLFIEGRKKNLIILGSGENVSPEELENKFVDHLVVKEVLIYEDDNKITAEIYPNEEYCIREKITDVEKVLRTVVERVNSQLPGFKAVRQLKIREIPFERTSTNKIKRIKQGVLV